MAVDLAVIQGTAFDDIDNNGLVTPGDTLIAGATVQLYRDTGDNIFNSGTDTLLGTATTNASGCIPICQRSCRWNSWLLEH